MRKRNLKKQVQNRPLAGNPKHEFRNPTTPVVWPDVCCPVSVGKRVEWMLFEKTKPIFEGKKGRIMKKTGEKE
jgi:hypothetical protein